MLNRRAELLGLRQLAVAALGRYPLADGRLSHAVDSEAAIRSEVAWLQAIRRDTELAVPEPATASDGAPAVTVTASGRTRVCSVLRWMDGRIHEASARPVHLARLGEAMTCLHDQADAWSPPEGFIRIRWDHESFFGNVMGYGDTPAAGCWDLLPGELRARFRAVGERMADIIPGAGDTGLIHADLHLGNALFQRGAVKLIDFDDCGTGPRLYDLAVALWEPAGSSGLPGVPGRAAVGLRGAARRRSQVRG